MRLLFVLDSIAYKVDSIQDQSVQINQCVFQTCCGVLERMLKPYDDKYLDERVITTNTAKPKLQGNDARKGRLFVVERVYLKVYSCRYTNSDDCL